ncbi:MAG: hypothetical protein DI555_07860 [Novosphingobium pentaromativorans]|uniref:Uncharacterized protein n=1 Tax=Novosphingobium pentaromativorans TaxID=205844 RepID=A0A2W5NS62_9SPHN|nr:MAG: hypothetical protein DI555_07860 [Novosphingobium pentaromativorans]
MAKMLRTAGMVVAAVALVAMTAGAAAPAVAATATTAASAGGIAGVSAATLGAIGAYGGLAAAALTSIAAATAPGMSSQGTASKFQTNPQSGLPYAMGRTRMSGLRFFAATNTRPGYTKFNDLLWFGALLSIGGQIEGIEKFTADGEVVTFDASGNANGNFRDYMAQKVHLGGPMATALNLSLGGGTAPGWTAQHKLSGITHAMWCLRYNKQGEMYGAGAPEPAWIGKWVKVYDPRLDSTYPGGSGPCRALQESTYVWSDNPGLHALTWALGRWQNGERTCGIGAPVETIRIAEFVECANVCEANGWKVGGVEWTTDSKWDTLKRILQAGGARPTQTAAMIGCLVNTPRTAIATIESRHLHDGLSLAATKSRRERISSVIPRYVDEDSDWELISGTAITVAEYATADKGKRTKEIDFPLVQVFSGQEAKQPGQLAAYEIVNSREAGPWTFTTGPEWIGLKTGDVVYLNVPEEGLVNQPVMITRRAIDPSTGKVSFAVETETYAKHAFALGETTTPPAPWAPTAPDLKPPAPIATGWTVAGTTSGEGFPALLIAGESEMPSADAVVIDYRLHQENETATEGWTNSAILSAVDTVRHVISPLQSETRYDVRISYRVEAIDGDATIFEQVLTGVGKITTIENQLDDLAQAGKVTAHLSVPAVSLFAYANGGILDYSAATGKFVVLRGTDDVSSSFEFAITANPANLEVSLVGNTYKVTGGLDEDSASLTMRASGSGAFAGTNFDLVFTVSRMIGGYEIVATLPTTNLFEGRIVYNSTDGKLYTYTSGAWKTGVNASDIAGDIVADQFAPGIEPVSLVTSVPSVKSTSVIFNQTDGKTYRWDGSAYVATVAAADIAGGLTATQFASGIEPVTLVSGALPTTRITNVITYGGKLYRWNGAAYVATTAAGDVTGTLTSAQIASLDAAKLAGQIVGTQITDGAVSTAKLAAGSVTAGQIAAGSVLASKMAITGENLWPDPQCQDIDWWKGPSQGALTSAFGYVNPENPSNSQSAGWQFVSSGLSAFSDRVGGSKGMWQLWSGNNNDQFTSGAIAQVVPPSIWAKGNTTYEIGVGCFNSSNKPVNFTVNMVNAAGAIINTVTPIVWSAGDTSTRYYKAKIKTTADTVSIRLYFEVPAGAAFSGAVNVGNISVREAAGGTMIVDGSITAGHIAADTITAAQIAAGAISASELAAGAVTTAKLAVVPSNLIPDPYFADTAWWTGTRLDAGGWYFEDNTNPGGAALGMGVPKILVLGPQNSLRKHCWSASVPFSGQGQVVRLRAMGSNATPDRMYLTVRFRGPAGDLGDLGVNWEPGAGVNLLRSAQMTVPTGTTHYQVIAFNEGNTNTGGWMWIGAPKLDVAASADLLVDGSITASKIAADTITAGQIAAGAISSSEIAAGAVTAAKMTVAEFENLLLNGDLASGNLDGWSRNYNGVDGMVVQCEDGGIGTGWPSRYVIHMLRNGRTGSNEISITNGVGNWDNNDKRFGIPVNPGDEFAFETTCWCSNGASVQFDMIMINTNGQLEWMVCEPVQNTYLNSTTNLGAAPGEGYVVLKGTFKYVGTNQGRANVRFMGPTASTPNAHCYFWSSKMRRRNRAELIVDGQVTASKVAAGAIVTDHLSAGAVTAAKLAVTELSAITGNIGLLRTASSGQRSELDNNGLRAYHPNSALAGRMGVW